MLRLLSILGGLLIMMGQHDRSEALFYYLSMYEKCDEPLSEYYPTMLKNLNVKYELARWEQTKKSRSK
jgi:hypothetical protein